MSETKNEGGPFDAHRTASVPAPGLDWLARGRWARSWRCA